MMASLDRLFARAIDFAGVFPPARQELSVAWTTYLRHLRGPEAGWVARFACPADQLPALAQIVEAEPPTFAVEVTVAGRALTEYGAWQDARVQEAEEMSIFEENAPELVTLGAYELRVADGIGFAASLRDLYQFEGLEWYAELPWTDALEDQIAAVSETEGIQAKVRTGGATADHFPSSAHVSAFLHHCASIDLPCKLTGGLHHPLPTLDPVTGGRMHGFVNVFGGLALTLSNDLSRAELAAILDDADPKAWSFEEKTVRWRDLSASVEFIEEARSVLVSIGSCSIDEPWSELETLLS
ncbi:MAG: hypothetical protein ACOYON_06370 [Fimbriimonas sp.]